MNEKRQLADASGMTQELSEKDCKAIIRMCQLAITLLKQMGKKKKKHLESLSKEIKLWKKKQREIVKLKIIINEIKLPGCAQ